MPSQSNEMLPLKKAFLWVLLWTLVISGSALMGWLYYQHARRMRLQDEQYRIVAIVPHTIQKEVIKPAYLAEVLGLSFNKPSNLYAFNSQEGVKKLLACPLIQQASIKKILPGTLYIDYTLRIPIAYLADQTNTAVDGEGIVIPFTPFFTPKKLPAIRLAYAMQWEWGKRLDDHAGFLLSSQVLSRFEELNRQAGHPFFLQVIDVADAFADSYGKRQVILIVEKGNSQMILRLNTEHFKLNLNEFFRYAKMEKSFPLSSILDFRIPQLAFIKVIK